MRGGTGRHNRNSQMAEAVHDCACGPRTIFYHRWYRRRFYRKHLPVPLSETEILEIARAGADGLYA